MVERKLQKRIIVVHKGAAFKKAGMQARKYLETFL